LAFFFAAFFFFAIGWYLHQAYKKNGLTIITVNLLEASFKISKKLKNVVIVSIDQNNKNPSKKILIERFYRVN
jgi:hypothetical protein